jgi:hypothetical protein
MISRRALSYARYVADVRGTIEELSHFQLVPRKTAAGQLEHKATLSNGNKPLFLSASSVHVSRK